MSLSFLIIKFYERSQISASLVILDHKKYSISHRSSIADSTQKLVLGPGRSRCRD